MEEICQIPVQGKLCENFGNSVFCSIEDFEELSRHKWIWSREGFAVSIYNRQPMHRLVKHALPGQSLNHIDGNKANNSRRNLRFAYSQLEENLRT